MTKSSDMAIYAVIDTNVVVSGSISKNPDSPTRRILSYIYDGKLIPMVNHGILYEYQDVLSRKKFNLKEADISEIINLFKLKGEIIDPVSSKVEMIDPDDVIFYETYIARKDDYLVTGNLKHYPIEGRIVSPADMIQILCQLENGIGFLSERTVDYISESKKIALEKAWATIESIRERSARNGVGDMTMEEIDEEIRQYRKMKVR